MFADRRPSGGRASLWRMRTLLQDRRYSRTLSTGRHRSRGSQAETSAVGSPSREARRRRWRNAIGGRAREARFGTPPRPAVASR